MANALTVPYSGRPKGGWVAKKIWELNTIIRTGSPIMPGMSNTTKPTTKTKVDADKIAGLRIGRTIVRIIFNVPAPEADAASSKLGSMFLKAGESIRKVEGTRASPCTKHIPERL